MARTRVAFQYVTYVRITINAFTAEILIFSLSQSLMEKNVKFVLNDLKATFSSHWHRKATSHVTLHNDILQHPDLKNISGKYFFTVRTNA